MVKKIIFISSVYNRCASTHASINAIRNAVPSGVSHRFIIYDANSSDGTADTISRMPDVSLIAGETCVYWAGGVKCALAHLKRDTDLEDTAIVFFNDDVCFFENRLRFWLADAAQNLLKSTATGGLCEDNSGQISYGGFTRSITKMNKVYNHDNLSKIVALNFNLAMFPATFILSIFNDTFDFTHGYADIYTSNKFTKCGGKLHIPEYSIGLCEKNDYLSKYKVSTLHNYSLSELFTDPKYFLIKDLAKFSQIFGLFRWYVVVRGVLGVILKWMFSKVYYKYFG